jgi:hypothetical protein
MLEQYQVIGAENTKQAEIYRSLAQLYAVM